MNQPPARPPSPTTPKMLDAEMGSSKAASPTARTFAKKSNFEITHSVKTSKNAETYTKPTSNASKISGKGVLMAGLGRLALSEIFFARMLIWGAAAIYGTNFSLIKLLGQSRMPVGISSMLRFGMAALATSPMLLAPDNIKSDNSMTFNHKLKLALKSLVTGEACTVAPGLGAAVAGVEVGLWNTVGYITQALGLKTVDASKSAFLCSLAFVVAPVLDYAFRNKMLQPKEIAGAAMALVGVAFLELGDHLGTADLLRLSTGDLLSLCQPLAFGMGFWRMEKAMELYPDYANKSTAAHLCAIFIISVAFCIATWDTHAVSVKLLLKWFTDPFILLELVWTGVISTALTVFMETVALKTISASETTLIFSSEPVWGTVFAVVLLGEHVTLRAASGALLILFGCLYANLGPHGIGKFVRSFCQRKILVYVTALAIFLLFFFHQQNKILHTAMFK